MQFKLGSMQISWDIQHSLIMIGSTVGGAVLGYLESQPTTTLIAAFGSWDTAKPVVFGALSVAIAALISLAKQTFVVPAAPTQGSHGGPQLPKPMTPQPKDSVPPTTMRREIAINRRALRSFVPMGLLCAAMSFVTLTSGCAAWQKFVDNPVDTAQSLAGYVQTFLQVAGTVFNMILPLLGSAAPQAQADFNTASLGLQTAVGEMIDAAQLVAVGKASQPDLDKATAAVQDAVQRVIILIDALKKQPGVSGKLGAQSDTLGQMGARIQHWGK